MLQQTLVRWAAHVDIWWAFARSAWLGLAVMLLTVLLWPLAGLAYRKRFRSCDALFFVVIASLIMPPIVRTRGAHLTWTVPFCLLIRFAIFKRFDPRYQEAAHDLGASPLAGPAPYRAADHRSQRGRHRLVWLSWDEIACSSQAVGLSETPEIAG